MKTIEERAKEHAPETFKSDDILPTRLTTLAALERKAYIAGATEQKAIDIEKACKWLKEQVYQEYGGGPLERLIPDTMIEKFRKAMEE